MLSAGLLVGGLAFALHPGQTRVLSATGHADALRLAIGWAEVVAATLFAFTPTLRLGAALLLIVLTVAAVLHLALHQFPTELFIYMTLILLLVSLDREQRG